MLTFADIGIPPWNIAPALITQAQVGFVASALVDYAAAAPTALNNPDPALQRAGVAISPRAKGRIVIELTDETGAVLDFVATARRLGSGGLSRWVSEITPVFHEAFGMFDPSEVYASCIAHYEVESCQWMPLPSVVMSEFMTWSRVQQAMFLHYFVWWYDRDFYRDKSGIADALAYLKNQRLHLGRWRFKLRNSPLVQASPDAIALAAREAIQTIVQLLAAALNDPWVPEAMPYVSAQNLPNASRLHLERFHSGFSGADRRSGPKSSDVLKALGRDSQTAQLPELLLAGLWNAQWWRDEVEVPRLSTINALAKDIERLAKQALELAW